MKENKNQNFVKQAAFLSIAGIIVRIIGVIYIIPVTNIIGDLGNGYYQSAYTIYSIVLMICSYSIPMAISKIMSEKISLNEQKNANRFFISSLGYVIVIGGIASILVFAFSSLIVDAPQATLALEIFAPTIFFSGILSVFRGFFQAQKTMIPTAISQLVEQILNAVISIVASYFLTKNYLKSRDSIKVAQYGAAGNALGTGAGVLAGLVFILIIFLIFYPKYKKTLSMDTHKNIMSYPHIFQLLLFMVTPVIISTFVYNASTFVDMKIFYIVGKLQHSNLNASVRLFGIYSRKYVPLSNLPIALASSMVSALVPEISISYAKKDFMQTNQNIQTALHYCMLIILPASVGLSVLADPIMKLLFGTSNSIAATLLTFGMFSIIFTGISTLFNGALQGLGLVDVPMKNAFLALVLHVLILIPLLLSGLNVYALLISSTAYAILVSILNLRKLYKTTGYFPNMKKTFLYPFLICVAMGISAKVSYIFFFSLFSKTFVSSRTKIGGSLFCSIAIAAFVYLGIAISTKTLSLDLFRKKINR